MTRVKILVEGLSELRFVQLVLTPWFAGRAIHLQPFRATTSRDRAKGRVYRGGGRSYAHVRNELRREIKAEGHKPDVWFSSMLDLYGLPVDFPGFEATRPLQGRNRAEAMEHALGDDIDHRRFIPHLQLHEFETLLFVDLAKLGQTMQSQGNAISDLQSEVADKHPEDINETPDGAPSKRIIRYLPGYQHREASAGPTAARDIGVAKLRDACPHFHAWLAKLESVGHNA